MSSTYLTFGPCPIAREVWRTNVSRIATAHPYLMHLLLSVSALHFSFLHASSRSKYELIAASHYNTGSQALREVIALWESSDGQAAIDSEALFAASGMLLFYVVASPHLPVPKSLTWFPLMTGIRAIMGAHGHVLRDGELADLVGGRKGDEAGTPTSSQDRMEHKKYRIFPELPDHLFTIYLNLPSTPEVAEVEDPEVASIYQMAVNQLKELCDNAPDPLAMVFVWPGVVSSEFLGYVIEERSRALVILAYYCAVSWTGVNEWWMKGQVAAELGGIRNLLGDSWQGWLEWPDSILQTVTGTLGAGG